MTPPLLISLATSAHAQVWWDASWAARAQIRFDNTSRAEDLLDFPVLVLLDEGVTFEHSLSPGGADLRFVDDDLTELSYDIDQWNIDGRSRIWVRVPQIDAGSATDRIWMYYGNPYASPGENAASTWSSSYTGVWHLDGSTPVDATLPAESAYYDDTTPTPGAIGDAQELDDDDSIRIVSESSFDYTGAFTISAWLKTDEWQQDSWDAVVTKGWTFGLTRCNLDEDDYNTESVAFRVEVAGGTAIVCSDTTVTNDIWHHLVGVFDPAAQSIAIYVDGDPISASETRLPVLSDQELWIASNAEDSDESLSYGLIDEVRAQSVARSADWIDAEHENIVGDFLSFCSAWIDDIDADGVCDVDDLCPGENDGIDADHDGTPACLDCDDNDSAAFPDGEEIPNNGIDEDCSGADLIEEPPDEEPPDEEPPDEEPPDEEPPDEEPPDEEPPREDPSAALPSERDRAESTKPSGDPLGCACDSTPRAPSPLWFALVWLFRGRRAR